MNLDNPNKDIIKFLRDLTISLENNTISPKKKQRVGEFYMSDKLYEIESSPETRTKDTFLPEDILKYITAGWYLYFIKNSEPVSNSIS